MNFQEALHALADGKKIQVKKWADGSYLVLDKTLIRNSTGDLANKVLHMYAAEEWALYEEPKTITLWRRPLVKFRGERAFKIPSWYSSKEAFTDEYRAYTVYGDWESQEIEVDA